MWWVRCGRVARVTHLALPLHLSLLLRGDAVTRRGSATRARGFHRPAERRVDKVGDAFLREAASLVVAWVRRVVLCLEHFKVTAPRGLALPAQNQEGRRHNHAPAH